MRRAPANDEVDASLPDASELAAAEAFFEIAAQSWRECREALSRLDEKLDRLDAVLAP